MQGVEVQIPRAGGPSTAAYAAVPDRAKRGVVVIHEIFGRQPEIDRVVDRFAAAGYAAVGPDLFAGSFKPVCIRRALSTIASGEGPIAARIDEARRWLCAEAKLDEPRVGVIGFCIGGGLALAVGRQFGAVSSNYGDVPPEPVLRGSPPIIGCYGGRDRVFRRSPGQLRERVAAVGGEAEIHVFDGVGHSFLTDGDHPVAAALSWPLFQIRYDAKVADGGWQTIMAFFDRTL